MNTGHKRGVLCEDRCLPGKAERTGKAGIRRGLGGHGAYRNRGWAGGMLQP